MVVAIIDRIGDRDAYSDASAHVAPQNDLARNKTALDKSAQLVQL